jgi:carbamoyltransferase
MTDPRKYGAIRENNTAIMRRCFWMPFAPTLLEERDAGYLLNPKPARYMILGF